MKAITFGELTRRDASSAIVLVLLGLAGIAVSFGVVHQPWLLTGVVFGAIVLVVAISAPLALVAATLMMGAVDLSFMTGGFKALFPELGGLDMNGIRLVGATAGFTAFIMHAPAGRRAVFSTQSWFYLLFLVYAACTLAYSFDKLEGIRFLLKLAYPLVTLLLIIGLCDTREKLETLTRYTLVAAALIIFVINPLFTLKAGYRIDPDGFKRIRGIGAHENPFSFYLMIMMFIGLTRLIYRRQVRYLFFCIGAVIWISLTLTRITLLAATVGVLLITLLASVRQRQYRALAGGLVVTLLLAVTGVPFLLERSLGWVPTPAELIELLRNPVALYESINWQGRTNLWPIVWSGFMAAPIIGLGLGSSGVVIRQHFPTEAANVAHNEYLRLAADTGMVGILLFAAAMSTWLWKSIQATRSRNQEVAEYALPAFAGLIGWAIIAVTDNPFDAYMYYTQYVGFLIGATMVSLTLGRTELDVDHRLS